jgi:hypothetical protein
VVTSFEYQLHPVDNVIAGPMFWPLEQLEPTLRWYRDWLPHTVEDVNAFYLVGEVPATDPFPSELQAEKICGLMWCCLESEQRHVDKAIQQARDVASPLFEHIGSMPYPVLQSTFDDFYGRLQEIKAKYDPDNFFHVNQNIEPKSNNRE